MNMTPVKSQAVSSVGYDPDKRAMRVLFKNGGLYHYDNITPEQHQKLMGADSIGAHLGKHHGKSGVKVKK